MYLTLVLHLLCGPSHYVDVGWRKANRQINRDVLGGAVGCKNPHVGLIKEESWVFRDFYLIVTLPETHTSLPYLTDERF